MVHSFLHQMIRHQPEAQGLRVSCLSFDLQQNISIVTDILHTSMIQPTQ